MTASVVNMDYIREDLSSWMIDTSGRYATAISNYLIADGIPEDGTMKIMQNAAKVLGYCPDPSQEGSKQMTGIVIGKVQSGKTSNFIALTALAFDNGYDHVVVFGGTNTVLVRQNGQRIEEYFEATPEVVVINSSDHKAYMNSATIGQWIRAGKKVIIVALKRPQRINEIRTQVFSDPELADSPTLIIDDEGDEASLNTLVSKGKKSSTYLAIEKLKGTLHRHCFVSVTATPQANLLISSMDILSPEFGVLVDPGKGYCGLDVFHSPDSKLVVEIPDTESSLLDSVPNSFNEALATYFVGCSIFLYRGKKPSEKFSMLVHPSQLKVDHSSVKGKTESIVSHWRTLSQNKGDIAYRNLKKRLLKAYEDYKLSGTVVPSFDELEDGAIYAINNCQIHLVNGDSVPKDADKFFDFNIYVGGTMLGRGLTIKGLAVTYIIRTPKGKSNVDTTAQRARWFGYKEKYLDLCRVYAVKKIIQEFIAIREHENDLWETVRDANLQGTNFKDIARIFVLSDDLRMTRTNVANTDKFVFKPWNIQRCIHLDPEYAKSNMAILQQYRNSRSGDLKTVRFGSESSLPYVMLENVPFDEVKNQIIDNFLFPERSDLQKDVIMKLGLLLRKKTIDASFDVIWMRDGSHSFHDVNDGDLPNYMVGRRPDDYKLPAIYEGDRYQFVKPSVMQLQIHVIEDRVTHIVSPALALYIPVDYIEKLTNLVIRR